MPSGRFTAGFGPLAVPNGPVHMNVNVEDRLGHWRYLGFYLVCGLGAGLAHTLLNLQSTVPTIGASGAVAGVLGAYFLLYPRARVLTLLPLFYIFLVRELPAYLILLYWFVLQLFSGRGLNRRAERPDRRGGLVGARGRLRAGDGAGQSLRRPAPPQAGLLRGPVLGTAQQGLLNHNQGCD